MVIISINFEKHEFPMLLIKFQDHSASGSEKEDFKGFYHIYALRPPWSCYPEHSNNPYNLPMAAPHRLWL